MVGKAFLKFSSFSTALTKPVAPCLRYLRGIGLLRCHRIGGALKGCRRGSMSAFVGKADIGSLTPTSKSVRVPAELASSQRLQGWLHAPARFHKSCCGLSNRLAVHGACARAHTVSRPPQYRRRGRSRTTVTNCSVQKSLQELGWTDGSIRIEARWAGGDVERLRKHSKELVALGPDVILTSGSVTVRPLQ